jgi:hypothetical protein
LGAQSLLEEARDKVSYRMGRLAFGHPLTTVVRSTIGSATESQISRTHTIISNQSRANRPTKGATKKNKPIRDDPPEVKKFAFAEIVTARDPASGGWNAHYRYIGGARQLPTE